LIITIQKLYPPIRKFKPFQNNKANVGRKKKGKKKNKSKSGKVYLARYKTKTGKTQYYTGQTNKTPKERMRTHKKNKDFLGKQRNVKLVGVINSSNRFKAEKTIKNMPKKKKLKLFRKKR